jgi:hypothetical protein
MLKQVQHDGGRADALLIGAAVAEKHFPTGAQSASSCRMTPAQIIESPASIDRRRTAGEIYFRRAAITFYFFWRAIVSPWAPTAAEMLGLRGRQEMLDLSLVSPSVGFA